jgi:antitoxin MazE
MHATITKWGNSLALRLPRHVIEEARLVEGATVRLEVEDGMIRITPTRRRFKLPDLLGNELAREADTGSAEHDWGTAKGEESW